MANQTTKGLQPKQQQETQLAQHKGSLESSERPDHQGLRVSQECSVSDDELAPDKGRVMLVLIVLIYYNFKP